MKSSRCLGLPGRQFLLGALALSFGLLTAPTYAAKKSTVKRTKITGDDTDVGGGADGVDGWIIKTDKDGHVTKVPRKQTFKFGGSKVEGAVTRPAESALAARTSPSSASLIPIRKTFRKEFMESAGAPEGRNTSTSGER